MTEKQMMIAYSQKGIFYFKFHLLAGFSGLVHGILARLGGCSPAPCDSLNLGFNEADARENVTANRRLAAQCLGLREPIYFANQVHGTTVVSLKRDETAGDPLEPEPITGDGLMTDIPGLPLGIQLADCQGILMYDPVRAVIGSVHAGWRGSIKNIAGIAVRQMQTDFDCNPADILAAVSPSLGPCCSEFKNYRQEIPKSLWGYRDSRNFFDFWAITRKQLKEAGILHQHMAFAHICTKCNDHLFFSYRKTHPTGRFAAVIGLAAP